MTDQRNDDDLFERFAARLARIEEQIPEPPPFQSLGSPSGRGSLHRATGVILALGSIALIIVVAAGLGSLRGSPSSDTATSGQPRASLPTGVEPSALPASADARSQAAIPAKDSMAPITQAPQPTSRGQTPQPSPLSTVIPSPVGHPSVRPAPTLGPSEIALETAPPGSNGGGDALLVGILRGKVGGHGTGCFWLDQASATSANEVRTALVWPYGYRAYDKPLRIDAVNPSLVLRIGDHLELGGGGPGPSYAPTAKQDPCDFGHIYGVSSIVSVNGTLVSK
jgi:hypothetical protein